MDALSSFLDALKKSKHVLGHLRGLLHILIGRSITRIDDGTVISKGLTWREAASLLKKARWDPEMVRELGLDPDALPPRDRQRYWYMAIAHAKVDSPEAIGAGNRLVDLLCQLGYAVK